MENKNENCEKCGTCENCRSKIEKERQRCRDKYYRLGYKGKYYPNTEAKKVIIQRYKEKNPEIIQAKNAANTLPKCEKGIEKHHWSYNKEHYKDVILLPIKQHNTVHRFLSYDKACFMYRTLKGNLLDTKQKHENYIKQILQENE
jgi:hypothetical protein